MKKIIIFSILFLHFSIFTSQAQNWLELRESGASYPEVKAAFLKQYKNKLSKFKRESRKEAKLYNKHRDDDFEKEMEGIVHFMRWSTDVEPRVAAFNGDLKAMDAATEQALIKQKNSAQSRSAGSWTLIGPTSTPTSGGNGRVAGVRTMPGNNNILFACTPAGGLWKSTNSGANWTVITDAIPVIGATDLAIDPTNTNIMYLATGDGDAGDVRSTGIYKSTDGGVTWNTTGLTFASSQGARISRILIDPTTLKLFACGNIGIYTSVNGGANWTRTSSLYVKDLDFNPANTNTIYAGGYQSNVFLRSYDAGVTWTSNGVSGTGNVLPTSGTYRVAVATTALDTNYIYCLIANNSNLIANHSNYGFNGLYLSIDGGSNFTLQSSATTPSATTPNVLGWNYDGSDLGGQGWYDLSIVVDPTNKNIIYTGGVNIWKNTNAGATGSWSCNAHWYGANGLPYVHADNHDLFFVGSTLYSGNDGGVFSTANGGTSWSNNSSNLSNAQIYSIGLSATNANKIISGHQDNGTNYTSNLSTWKEVNEGDGFVCFFDRTNDQTQFSSIYYGALYKSTNGGTNTSSLYTVSGGAWVTPWLQDPNNATTLFAAGSEVVKSTNLGANWSNISSLGLASSFISLDVAKSNSNFIAAANSSALVISTNGGVTWVNKTLGLPSGTSILKVYFDYNFPTTIYVNLASYSGGSVYKSTDGGTTWANFSTGLPNVPASALVQQNNGDLYCGTDIGVYFRAVNAITWSSVTTGMPGAKVSDLKIFEPTNKLRAATYGRGIWEMDLKNTGLVLNAKVFLQGPFNSATGLMNDALRSLASFPLTSPYGTNETINASVLSVSGNNAIVDWVKVELHDKSNVATVIQSRSALLQSDGDIVDVDGVSPLFFTGLADDSYYVIISHRNHLGVRSNNAVTSYAHNLTIDFTNTATPIYGNIAVSNSVNQIYAGDINASGLIDASDRSSTWNNKNQTGYLNSDCNLNGIVDASDRAFTWNNRNKTNQ